MTTITRIAGDIASIIPFLVGQDSSSTVPAVAICFHTIILDHYHTKIMIVIPSLDCDRYETAINHNHNDHVIKNIKFIPVLVVYHGKPYTALVISFFSTAGVPTLG